MPRAELMCLCQVLADRPVLGNPAILNPEQVHTLYPKTSTAWWNSLKFAPLVAFAGRIGDDTVALGDQLFNAEMKIRERLEQPAVRALESVASI
jgi:hypothetical protein